LWIFLEEILLATTRRYSFWRVDITAVLAHFREEGGPQGKTCYASFLPSFRRRSASRRMRHCASSWCQIGISTATCFVRYRPCGEHPRSTSRVAPVGANARFMSWRAADSPEAIDALSMGRNFHLAFLFPSIPLLKRVVRKLEVSRGIYLLVTPYWEAQTWFTSFQLLPVLEVRRLPFHDALVVDLATGEPPPSLEQFFLIVWRICGGLGESMPSQTGLSGLSRQDGSRPLRTGTKGLGNPSSLPCALPPFLSIRHL
jgi:hypothetical protein